MSRIGESWKRIEHRQVALAGDAESQLDAVQLELVDERLAAASHRSDGLLEEDRRPLELRLLLVGRVEVADRALARPLGGQQQHAHERRVLGRTTPSRAPGGRRPRATTRPPGTCASRPATRSSARRAANAGCPARDGRAGRRPRRAESRHGRSGGSTRPALDLPPAPTPARGRQFALRRNAPRPARGRKRRGFLRSSRRRPGDRRG